MTKKGNVAQVEFYNIDDYNGSIFQHASNRHRLFGV